MDSLEHTPLIFQCGFNLVIEVLFFSRITNFSLLVKLLHRFNLVIEVLFFSSIGGGGYEFRHQYSFNLVIEVLFFSRDYYGGAESLPIVRFQSRNRGSFLFKLGVWA